MSDIEKRGNFLVVLIIFYFLMHLLWQNVLICWNKNPCLVILSVTVLYLYLTLLIWGFSFTVQRGSSMNYILSWSNFGIFWYYIECFFTFAHCWVRLLYQTDSLELIISGKLYLAKFKSGVSSTISISNPICTHCQFKQKTDMTFMGGSCPLGKLYCQRQICVESDCDEKEKFVEQCDIAYTRRSNKGEERAEKTMIKRVKDRDRSYFKWQQRATKRYLLFFS